MKNIFTRIFILLPFLLSVPHALAQNAEIELQALLQTCSCLDSPNPLYY
jgi:hypothetical protein